MAQTEKQRGNRMGKGKNPERKTKSAKPPAKSPPSQQNDRLFHEAFLSNPDNILIIKQSDLTIVDANDEFLKIIGIEHSDLINKQVKEIGSWSSSTDHILFRRLLEDDGRVDNFETKMRHSSGEEKEYLLSARTFEDNGGRYIVMTLKDLSPLRVIEEAFERSERKYRLLADNANDLIYRFLLKPEPKFDYVSKSSTKLTGYSPQEHYDDPFLGLKIIHPDDRDAIEKMKAFPDRWSEPAELRWIRKDGSVMWTEQHNRIVRDETGDPVAIEGIARDITERKKMEDELRLSEMKYRDLVETSQELIWQADDQGQFIYLNPAWEKTHGYKVEEMLGKRFADFQKPEVAERDVVEFGRHLAGDNIYGYETTHISKGGETIHLVFNAIPRKDLAGNVIGAHGTAHDVTKQRKIEMELAKSERIQSMGILAGGIAHDFNNILTSMWGNITLAKMHTKESEENFDLLAEAEIACKRARDLTKQLLSFAKGGTPVKKATSLNNLLTESATFVLRGSNVKPRFSLANDLWRVDADEGQIAQVIHNLVLNAAQAMPNGGLIDIKTTNAILAPESSPAPNMSGRFVKITFADNGIGIPEDYLARIFDPYFTTKQLGSGLGLATTYSIIKSHEGHIEARSEVGRGATFEIYLPAASDCARQPMAVEGVAKTTKRILIMDDDDGVRRFIAKILRKLGYEVDDAEEGAKAVALYADAMKNERAYDVVILDLMVPGGMGGAETIKRLKELDPDVRAIVASGYSDDPIMADPESFGFKKAAPKPLQISDIDDMIKSALQ